MHHLNILQKILAPVIHKKRLTTLQQMVQASFLTSTLSVTQLGRVVLNQSDRSGIRKADRFLSNSKLQKEYPLICQALCQNIIGNKQRPWIIVDWTDVPNRDYHILRAALVAKGRAITLYEEIHNEKELGNTKVQERFLDTLKVILPKSCNPIIITDAGFSVPWFKKIMKLNWDYVGRVRGNKYYSRTALIWLKCKGLTDIASSTPKYLGKVYFTKKHAFSVNMYVIKNILKGRHSFTLAGTIRQDANSKNKSQAAREPLCLVTSLKNTPFTANKIVKIYQTRMQIEEGIRDLKSTKYGFGFEHMRSYKPKRILILLLIAMIASFIAWIIGYIAEMKNLHYQYQANSIKNKRILSFSFLGRRIIKRHLTLILYESFEKIIDNIQNKFVMENV
jgi:hypothetical protein